MPGGRARWSSWGSRGRSRRACVVGLGDQAFEVALGAESVAQELVLCHFDGVGLALVFGQMADEGEDERGVGGRGGANKDHEKKFFDVIITMCAGEFRRRDATNQKTDKGAGI